MLDPPVQIIDSDNTTNAKQLIKQAQINKISKKSGELMPRYLILLSDTFFICHTERNKKLPIKYKDKVEAITVIHNSDPNNELVFRVRSSVQNDEFLAE